MTPPYLPTATRIAGAFLLLATCASLFAARARPNVLFVISDDLGSRIAPAGYPAVQTPVLDRLARESVTFRKAYCQYPVCGPSRASFLSGLYPESTGVLDNVAHLDATRPGTPTLPGVFRQAGYWTASVGKVFHKPLENPGDNTWDATERFENDELAVERAGREAFEAQHGPVTAPKNRAAWRDHALTLSPLTRNQGVKGLGPGYGPTGLTDAQHADGKNARRVASWITDKAHGDRPFMIACGFHKPHIPFLAPDAYFKLYPKTAFPVVRPPADDWSDIPAIADTKQYLDYGFPAKGTENESLRREFMQAYYACISFVDAQLGLIIDALKASGQWDNTIVVFIGDHGYLLGEHFMWGKVMLFEESARTPLLVRVPGVTQPGRISTGLVELVDIFPTLAQLCGVTPPAHLQGRSFVPLLESAVAPGKNHAYTVVRRGQELGRAVRFDRWRYTEWATPGQNELYDLTADPNEWTNLAPRPEHAALVRRASQLLAERRAAAEQQRLAAK